MYLENSGKCSKFVAVKLEEIKMSRIDLVRLRKRAGMSQKELADYLQVQPSFLSAIENGKSRLPEEKIEKIKEIFEVDNLDNYMIDTPQDGHVPPHTHTDQVDSLTQLLNHFHDLAHKNSNQSVDAETASRIDFLLKRNDRLSGRLDDLREEIDMLRDENFRLKEILLKNGINF